jgi:hypothetical protein
MSLPYWTTSRAGDTIHHDQLVTIKDVKLLRLMSTPSMVAVSISNSKTPAYGKIWKSASRPAISCAPITTWLPGV